MMVVWLAAGIIVVSLAYLLPSQAVDPWVPLNAAGIALLAYLSVLMAATTRKPFPLSSKILAWGVFLVVGAALAFAWTGFDAQAHFQSDQLTSIRHRIARGVINDHLSTPLLEALQTYHKQRAPKNKSIQAVFLELHPGARVGTNLYRPTYAQDSLMIIVTALTDRGVTLLGQEANVRGKDPNFKNWDGSKGMIQFRATLTAKGVVYESEN